MQEGHPEPVTVGRGLRPQLQNGHDIRTEEEFLAKFYWKMPRTMLRYAIEKFPETERKAYLHGTR